MSTDLRLLENTRRYRKTRRGLITNMYSKMRSRNSVEFSLSWLHDFAECKKFERLFNEWEKSKYRKEYKPSLDRIICSKGYTKKNVQWLTWSENRYKQTMERRCRRGPVFQMQGDKVIKKYISQRKAVMQTGIAQGNISACLDGRRATAGGYGWQYENPELVI